jgi:hypothetical protein
LRRDFFGLAAFLFLGFPSFISECCLGGCRSNSCIVRSVFSSTWGLSDMAKPKHPSPQFMRDLAEGVGRVIIASALLEHDFSIVLKTILKLNHVQERTLIRPMSISNKVTLLRALHKDYGKKGETDRWLRHLLKEIRHCADHRNDLAHGYYGHRNGKFAILTSSEGAKISAQPVSWTPKSLDQLVERIALLRQRLQNVPGTFPKNLKRPTLRQAIEPSVFQTV